MSHFIIAVTMHRLNDLEARILLSSLAIGADAAAEARLPALL
jgi:hypothetical protein